IELVDERLHPRDVARIAVIGLRRQLVGLAEADEVRRDRTHAGRHERRDHLAIEITPGRLTVQEQRNRSIARPLVEVMHAQAGDVEPVRLEAVARKVLEARVGRTENVLAQAAFLLFLALPFRTSSSSSTASPVYTASR